MVAMNNTIFLQDFCDEGHTTTAYNFFANYFILDVQIVR
jgi:hypothetical protein